MDRIVRIEEEKAYEVFLKLESLWTSGSGLFKTISLPQDRSIGSIQGIMKAYKDEEVARILFAFAIFMRGGILSEDPLKIFPYLAENYPGLFEPLVVEREWSAERIELAIREAAEESFSGPLFKQNAIPSEQMLLIDSEEIMIDNSKKRVSRYNRRTSIDRKKIYKADEFAKAWYLNFLMLARHFDGRVISIFSGVGSFEDAFLRVRGKIFGMRRKIFSLFTIWLQDRRIIPEFPTPLPIDFHALRIMLATGIIKMKARIAPHGDYPFHSGRTGLRVRDSLVTHVTKWSQHFLDGNGIAHRAVNPALWVTSRELCAFNYQNTAKDRGAVLVDPKALKDRSAWPKGYSDPCIFCPIIQHCKYSIPSAPYYQWGLLIQNGRRVPGPVELLPGINPKLIVFNPRRNSRR